jgi:GTP-binding protein HflX
VQAFRATLEETAQADLLLHVVDAASPERDAQIEEVERVLAEIGAEGVPQWQVWNKIDLLEHPPRIDQEPCGRVSRLFVSARNGSGLSQLEAALLQAVDQCRPSEEGEPLASESGPNLAPELP